jgi:hypothetical protein
MNGEAKSKWHLRVTNWHSTDLVQWNPSRSPSSHIYLSPTIRSFIRLIASERTRMSLLSEKFQRRNAICIKYWFILFESRICDCAVVVTKAIMTFVVRSLSYSIRWSELRLNSLWGSISITVRPLSIWTLASHSCPWLLMPHPSPQWSLWWSVFGLSWSGVQDMSISQSSSRKREGHRIYPGTFRRRG